MAKTSAPWTVTLCDECGQPVPENNSVRKYELSIGIWKAATARSDRHFNPVTGEHPCEGSPSRVELFRTEHGCNDEFIDTSLMGHCIDPEPDIQ